MRRLLSGLMAGCGLLALAAARAEDPAWPPPQPLNTYGHTGLLEMPSARMMNDGEFAVTLASAPKSFRTALSFQPFPWAELAFRYSRLDNYFLPDGRKEDLLDRSFSVKVRLMDETEYLPAVAIGLQDIIGTGVYGGEYVVASKVLGDFDVSLGLGWGRLGSVGMFRNPLSYVSDYFDNRPPFVPSDEGGTPTFKSLFRGRDVSLFGGVVWQTPIDGLKAIVEYSGDKYLTEQSRGLLKIDSQFNYGLSYRVADLLDTSLSYMYGNTVSFRISLRFDPTVEAMKVLDPPPLPPAVRPKRPVPAAVSENVEPAEAVDLSSLRGIQVASLDDEWSLSDYRATGNALIVQDGSSGGAMQSIMEGDRWYQVPAIREQIVKSIDTLAQKQGLGLEAIQIHPTTVSVYYENNRYYRETDEIHRMLRVLTTLPPSVEHFYLTSLVDGLPSTEVMVSRTAYERAVGQFSAVDNLLQYVEINPGQMEVPEDAIQLGEAYPRFDWSIIPRPRTLVFDQEEPFKFGLAIAASGSVEFEGGWKAEVTLSGDLIDTITDPRPGISELPHVRTDFRLYRDEGRFGIESLQVSKTGKLAPDWFYQVKAGYLEDMFGGVGGEVVWRPKGSNVSYGANLYYLKQRAYDRLFEFRDYDVVTGQVSIYWQDAFWRGVNVNVHAGRYLAGDWGATFEVTRKFDSGVEFGAYATFTDVPFDKFGEGSFDKGLILRIPFGWIAPFNTKYEASTYLQSLIKDGGQRLYNVNPLWEELEDTTEANIRRTWPSDVTPGL